MLLFNPTACAFTFARLLEINIGFFEYGVAAVVNHGQTVTYGATRQHSLCSDWRVG